MPANGSSMRGSPDEATPPCSTSNPSELGSTDHHRPRENAEPSCLFIQQCQAGRVGVEDGRRESGRVLAPHRPSSVVPTFYHTEYTYTEDSKEAEMKEVTVYAIRKDETEEDIK
ncbi:hypothetical protein AOLI_G00294350 [Acnodon oligacanthus]